MVKNLLIAIFLVCSIIVNCQSKKLVNPNWQQGKDTEKEYLLDSSEEREFSEAKKFCESQDDGAGLPLIKTKQEQAAVASLIKTIPRKQWVWLGAKNPGVAGQRYGKKFTWLDDSEISAESASNYFDLLPDNDFDGVRMYRDNGKWHHADYQVRNPSTLCERPSKSPPKTEAAKLRELMADILAKLATLTTSVTSLKERVDKLPA